MIDDGQSRDSLTDAPARSQSHVHAPSRRSLTDRQQVVERIRSDNRERFSSTEMRASLRVIDLTFEERWIYLLELVQNAVDAGASRIAISFGDDWLHFEHDGSEPLTEKSVEGMSGLFQSTKGVQTVGFMGIGFKSVFQRFQSVRVSGFGWSFWFHMGIEIGEEYGDRRPDLLGTVLPLWNDDIAPPRDGFTTRFELQDWYEESTTPADDVARALPPGDRTLLALLAFGGVRELTIGTERWQLDCAEEEGSHFIEARADGWVQRWRLFAVEYSPTKDAIRRLLERRRIASEPSELADVYRAAASPRTVAGVIPVNEDDVPEPPPAGKAYSLLPTASSMPFGLHISADWLVNISRQGLPELEDNEWQVEIVDRIADVLAKYLVWLTGRHRKPEALRAGFSALGVPDEPADSPIVRRLSSDLWRRRLRELLRDEEILPGFEKGRIRSRRASDTTLVPRTLRALSDDPEAAPALLFGGPTVAPGLLTRRGLEFLGWLELMMPLTSIKLRKRWPAALEMWWRYFDEESTRRDFLYALWAGLARLTDEDGWDALPTVPTRSGGWVPPARAQYLKEPIPSSEAPAVEAFLSPHLPGPETLPADGLVEALRGDADSSVRKSAWRWFERLATSVTLADVFSTAVSAELLAESPRLGVLIRLAQWARLSDRTALVTHLVVSTTEGRSLVPVEEALLAEPYVEHGLARRRIWPSAGVVVAEYVSTDPEGADAHEWRLFLEQLHVLGPVRLRESRERLGRHEKRTVAEFLNVDTSRVGTANSDGYEVVDYDLDPPLSEVDLAAVAGWLEAGHAALSGGRRSSTHAEYFYRSRHRIDGHRRAAWVEDLDSASWVPVEDRQGALRRPGDVLARPDPARPDAPVADLSDSLLETLTGVGIHFGFRVPEAPVLRRLEARGSDLDPYDLAAAIEEALGHVESARQERPQLAAVLRQISFPNPKGDPVPLDRLVRVEGPGARSGFGGWLAPVNAMTPGLRTVLLDPRMPVPVADRTTGQQALEYLRHVWSRARGGAQGLAQEVRDFLPAAYAYVLEDVDEDGVLAEEWERARASAWVFTNRGRWVACQGGSAPALGDVEDSLPRRFLPDDVELASAGHLGPTPEVQMRVAAAIGLPLLSERLAISPRIGASAGHPDWQRRFGDLLRVLTAARGLPEGEAGRIRLQPTGSLAMAIGGKEVSVHSLLDGSVLHVAGRPRRFAVDAASRLVDCYGLSQQAKTAVHVSAALAALDDPALFAEALTRFGEDFAPDFDLASLGSIREVRRATPPGRIEEAPKPDEREWPLDPVGMVQRASEALWSRMRSRFGTGGGHRQMPPDPEDDWSTAVGGPSPQQQARGKAGEVEMLRRLNLEGGHVGLEFVEDRRKSGRSHDFLCRLIGDGREVEAELKTYAPGGAIHFTLKELIRAEQGGPSYVLIGLEDDGGHPSGWPARRLDDPYPVLASLAQARISVDFDLPAESVFPAADDYGAGGTR